MKALATKQVKLLDHPRNEHFAMLAILVLALAVRLLVAILLPRTT
jgi:hypothetical protein